jgi:hypothetical protein
VKGIYSQKGADASQLGIYKARADEEQREQIRSFIRVVKAP